MSLATVDIAPLADAGEPAPVLLTVEEAARCLRVGRTTCYALIRAGELESLTIGGLRRVPADADALRRLARQDERRRRHALRSGSAEQLAGKPLSRRSVA